MNKSRGTWKHAGGKLRDEGADRLSDAELLSILIGSGIPGRSAEQIAGDLMTRFGNLSGLLQQPLTKLLEIRGLGDVRIIRIAAAFEIARRLVERQRESNEKAQ